MAADSVISIRGITNRYGSIQAVNDLHLEVFSGETFGFLGANGAGKTTTIRILLDLLRPTHGNASIHRRRGPQVAYRLQALIPQTALCGS